MAISHIWSDEYNGPAYTYFSPLRPIRATMLPDGFKVVLPVVGPTDEHYITTTEQLPESFCKQASLEPYAQQRTGL